MVAGRKGIVAQSIDAKILISQYEMSFLATRGAVPWRVVPTTMRYIISRGLTMRQYPRAIVFRAESDALIVKHRGLDVSKLLYSLNVSLSH
jgi:hypothetical protein